MLHLGIAAASQRAVVSGTPNTFSDDFSGTLANWTVDNGAGWSIATARLRYAPGTAYTENCIRYSASDTGTATQYAKITEYYETSTGSAAGLLFRSGATSGYKYVVEPYGSVVAFVRYPWDMATYTTIRELAFTFAEGDTLAATCQGSGVNTIVKVWKNTTNNTPYDKDNWDSASDPADVTLTDTGSLLTTNNADSGRYVGCYSWNDSNSSGVVDLDGFYGGGL